MVMFSCLFFSIKAGCASFFQSENAEGGLFGASFIVVLCNFLSFWLLSRFTFLFSNCLNLSVVL